MEQRDLEVLSRFEEVWQRVQHGKEETTEPTYEDVKALMDGLHYQWKGCRQLAFCTCGREKARLLALSERIKKQFSALQLQYYLETGDIHCSGVSPNFASYTPYNLRKLWQSTVENEGRIKKCNLNGNLHLVAEMEAMDAQFSCQKTELEAMIGALLR